MITFIKRLLGLGTTVEAPITEGKQCANVKTPDPTNVKPSAPAKPVAKKRTKRK